MDRRTFLALSALSVGALGLGLSGCAGSPVPAGAIRVAQYGSNVRIDLFRQLFERYSEAHPGTNFALDATSVSSYQDKLATQVSGGSAPTIMGIFHGALPLFGRQGAFAALDDHFGDAIRTSAFREGFLELGQIDGGVLGLSYGDNAHSAIYDADLVESVGMRLLEPGHTWEDLLTYSVDLGRRVGDGFWGTEDRSVFIDQHFKVWLLQRGKYTFTPDGRLGFDRADLTDWIEYWELMRSEGAAPPAAVTAEASGTFEQSALIRGYTANHITYANAIASMQGLTPSRLAVVPLPLTPGSGRTGHFVRGSNWVGLDSQADELEPAAGFLDFVLNDPVGVATLGAELGAPPNRDLRASIDYTDSEQAFIDYIDFLTDEFGDEAIPLGQEFPPAYNDVNIAFEAAGENVRFGRETVSEAVDRFFDTATRAVEVLT